MKIDGQISKGEMDGMITYDSSDEFHLRCSRCGHMISGNSYVHCNIDANIVLHRGCWIDTMTPPEFQIESTTNKSLEEISKEKAVIKVPERILKSSKKKMGARASGQPVKKKK